jgi:hypothetical protein
MTDNDSNTIKPVESLQNIPILTPAKRREQRKHHQQPHRENKEHPDVEQNNLADEPDGNGEYNENENNENTIDYCA